MTIKAVVFDLDGTLVDTAPDLMRPPTMCFRCSERRPITMDGSAQLCGAWRQGFDQRGVAATGDAIDESIALSITTRSSCAITRGTRGGPQ